MIPELPVVLNGITRTVMMDLAPEIKSAYGGLTIQLMSALLMMVSQEAERAAARLVEENDALVCLFNSARPAVADTGLRDELERAVAPTSPSLLVSALRERNHGLRKTLIRLHAQIETLDTPAARDLDAKIWAELVESTRRRQLDLANG